MAAKRKPTVTAAEEKKKRSQGSALMIVANELEVVDEDTANIAAAYVTGPIAEYRKQVLKLVEPVRESAYETYTAVLELKKTLLAPADEAEKLHMAQIGKWKEKERIRLAVEAEERRVAEAKEQALFLYDQRYDAAIIDNMQFDQQKKIDEMNAEREAAAKNQPQPEPVAKIPDAPQVSAPIRKWEPPAQASPPAQGETQKLAGLSARVVHTGRIEDIDMFLARYISGAVPHGQGILVVSAAKLNKWISEMEDAKDEGAVINWKDEFGIIVTTDTVMRRTGR